MGPILRANCYSRHRYERPRLPRSRRAPPPVREGELAHVLAPRAGGRVAASPGCRSHARGAYARWTQDGELLFTH